jgi:hypothetical protein
LEDNQVLKIAPYIALICRPAAVRDAALKRSVIYAMAVNAINGMLVMTALWIQMSYMFTVPLIVTIGFLFGPFFSFIVSSTCSRIQWFVGGRMGSPASYNDIYRIFAWSFLPLSVMALLNSLVLIQFYKPGLLLGSVTLLPFILIALLGVRNYCSNIIALHQFMRLRGAACLTLAFLLILSAFMCLLLVAFLLLGDSINELNNFFPLFMALG